MRKKGGTIGKKRAKREQRSSNEVTLARLAAAKLKREKTITMMKDRLDVKFKQRIRLIQDKGKCDEVFGSKFESPIEKIMAEIRAEMKDVMLAGVKKVHAARILGERVKFDVKSSNMTISDRKYRIKKNVHAIGWGREALALTSALERIIGDNMRKGLVVVPCDTISGMFAQPELFPKLDTHIRIMETTTITGDRIPDDVCVRANKNIADYCKKLKKKDILMVMFSPSSDDLLCLPREKIDLSEKNLLLETLASAGATERDILLTRTALSAIRGNNFTRIYLRNC